MELILLQANVPLRENAQVIALNATVKHFFLENELRKIGKADKIKAIETAAAISSCVSGMLKVEDDIFNNEHDTDTLMGDIIPDDFNEW